MTRRPDRYYGPDAGIFYALLFASLFWAAVGLIWWVIT